MKQISVTALTLTNFRSFGAPTTIKFSTGAGLKLITGTNVAEPRLGANGCGKSTIWDAVCFALYGTSVRGLRAGDLVTSGEAAIEVVLEITVDGLPVSLRRTAPPMRIYLDGSPVEQDEVDRLCGLSKARFLNSVVFGQAMPLFIDLPVPARGDILDEVLDLELWMRAAEAAGEQHREAAGLLIELRRSIARTQGRIEGLGDLDRFAAQQAEWRDRKQERLAEQTAAIAAAKARGLELAARYNDKELAPLDEAGTKERYEYFQKQHNRARERVTASNTEITGILKTMELLETAEACPTCAQSITADHATFYFEQVKDRLDELEKQRAIAILDKDTTAAEVIAADETRRATFRHNQERMHARNNLQRQIGDAEREVERLQRDSDRLKEENDPYEAEAARVRREHGDLTATLAGQQAEEVTMTSLNAALDFWRQGFRRVRLYCLDRVLQELTVETHNSLLALGLTGWQIAFKTASETKSGTVKLGVQIDITAPDATRRFETMSGGEAQRARLAVSLGLASLIQRWAGVRFDLEVFDEPTAWLSEQGVEDLLESLRSRAETGARSIWVCDHRALIHAGFDEVMQIVKTEGGGSQLAPAV